ncbi:uncharacterized protein FSUBG_10455 [Fusarium subglutinans]|uniref:Uncharacterized protein n=1 Tax=Gibberella subglutinans TaxID=42677 RepID=A0A8H5UM17_GIBSU|nr:uncharacterized protein FSUBG_10455 [Fusarium subglutinans]KAF5591529.1 hypothetical protein FSUBG_10455 [Fusarium subglutinans]
MPPKAPKAPKAGETLGGILVGGTLYAVLVTGLASILEKKDDKKDSNEEPKQAEPNWFQRHSLVKEKGYYYKQVMDEFYEKNGKIKTEEQTAPKLDYTILQLSEQDRLQAERMLKP